MNTEGFSFKGQLYRAVVYCAVLLLGACSASLEGGPKRVFSVNEEISFARSLSRPELYKKYAAASGNASKQKALRDQIVYSRMYGIDQYYSVYEADFTRERQGTEFYSALATLGLNSAGALVGGAGTKSILAAIASGVTSSKTAYQKSVLIEKTIDVLQKTMRANRKLVRASIIQRIALPPSAYPLTLALTDVESYYRAGTLTGALIGISETASEKLEVAKAFEEKVITVKFDRDGAGDQVRNFLVPNGKPSIKNIGILKLWLRKRGIRTRFTDFVQDPKYASDRLAFAREHNL